MQTITGPLSNMKLHLIWTCFDYILLKHKVYYTQLYFIKHLLPEVKCMQYDSKHTVGLKIRW